MKWGYLGFDDKKHHAKTIDSKLIHIVLDARSKVVAIFLESKDAADFASQKSLLHMPFNTKNKDSEKPPAIGAVYKA